MEDQGASPLAALLLDRFARKNPLAASFRQVLEQLFLPAAINGLFEAVDGHSVPRNFDPRGRWSAGLAFERAVV